MKTLTISILMVLAGYSLTAAEVKNLRCEYNTEPMGVETTRPRLSWNMVSSVRGDYQRACQILVASTLERLDKDNGDMWNSGRLETDRSFQFEYGGKALLSGASYYWKVKIWDKSGNPSAWSGTATWSMGLLSPADWGKAQWIAFKDGDQWKREWKQHKDTELSHVKPAEWPNTSWPWLTGKDSTIFTLYEMAEPKYDPSPLFRKEFRLKGKVKRAMLYICGLGYYEAFLNGQRVGDHVLDPAWTNYEQQSMYVTYDVTGQLNAGPNAIGVMLGRGQYDPLCNDIWGLSRSAWVDQPKLIARLRVEYTDGTHDDVVTDASWKTCGGPVVYDDTRQGELYDARLEQPGWNTPGFRCDNWRDAVQVAWNARLVSQQLPPIRCFSPVTPVKALKKGQGIMVYDIGQNIAGWARVTVKGPAGAHVLVEYCETPADSELVPNLSPSRFRFHLRDPHYATFYDRYVNVRQQNGYILKGEGEETFECHFSYKGFQYIRVTADQGVGIGKVLGIPVHSDLETAGDFTCSNPLINQLQKNSVNSLLNNYHSIGTDCPHREKQGWTADNYMAATASMYNFNMASFFEKWLTDLAGTQSGEGGLGTVAPSTNYDKNASTVWPAAIVFIPWDLYGFYADRKVLSDLYPVMDRFASSSLLRQVPGKPEIIQDVLGDWLAPLMSLSDTSRNNTMAPPEGFTLYGTAAHYRIVKRLSDINRILGKNREATEMDQWAERIASAFNHEFYRPDSGFYQGDKPTGYRQSANIVPLQYGLVPEKSRLNVLNSVIHDIHAKGDRISTGFIGTGAMMEYLPENDPELAYKLVTQKNYPGWGYMVAQGANSMWESWDGYDSRNHTPFCLVSAYFYRYLAGIQPDPDNPGFKQSVIDPSVVGDLTRVSAFYDTPAGRIRSSWKRTGDRFVLEVSIPANTTATIYIPAKEGTTVMESGKPAERQDGLEFKGFGAGKAVFRAGSGDYTFESLL